MRIIIAFDEIPADRDETQEMFFGDRGFLVDPNSSCNFDPKLDYEPEDVEGLDNECGKGNWNGICQTYHLAEYIFEGLFKNKKPLTKDEIIAIVKDRHFEGRPLYRDFPQKDVNGQVYSVKWHKYFKAEKKAAEALVDKFMSENEGKYFFLFNTYDILLHGGALTKDRIQDRFPHIKIDINED